jgi:hypothetical protein
MDKFRQPWSETINLTDSFLRSVNVVGRYSISMCYNETKGMYFGNSRNHFFALRNFSRDFMFTEICDYI